MSNLKHREFWIKKGTYQGCLPKDENFYSSVSLEKTEGTIHVREVLPSDDSLMESYREMLEAVKMAYELFDGGLISYADYNIKEDSDICKKYEKAIQKAEQVLGDKK